MKTILALCVVPLAVASSFAAEPTAPLRYWSDTWRGWHFYEEPEPELEHRAPPPPRPARSPSKPVPSRPAELIEFERLQKTLEETRHIAIMRPSEANVRRYMELEAQVVARASTFADMAQRIAWASPELDPTLHGRPVNAKALEVFDQLQMVQRSESIGALGRDHVLLFFFRGDCPYCHAFAPTLRDFQARHGIRVVAVSVDGGSMHGFADARRDNGISRTLQVSQVPAVYLAQPFTGVITPIGFGVLSEAQLLERVAIVGAAPTIGAPPLAGGQVVVKHSGAAP